MSIVLRHARYTIEQLSADNKMQVCQGSQIPEGWATIALAQKIIRFARVPRVRLFNSSLIRRAIYQTETSIDTGSSSNAEGFLPKAEGSPPNAEGSSPNFEALHLTLRALHLRLGLYTIYC